MCLLSKWFWEIRAYFVKLFLDFVPTDVQFWNTISIATNCVKISFLVLKHKMRWLIPLNKEKTQQNKCKQNPKCSQNKRFIWACWSVCQERPSAGLVGKPVTVVLGPVEPFLPGFGITGAFLFLPNCSPLSLNFLNWLCFLPRRLLSYLLIFTK